MKWEEYILKDFLKESFISIYFIQNLKDYHMMNNQNFKISFILNLEFKLKHGQNCFQNKIWKNV